MKAKLKSLFLAFLSATLLGSSAQAITYNDGDLFLGFYSTTSSKDYLLYLGNYTNYTTNGGAYSGGSLSLNTDLGIGTANQINADLSSAFGSDWFTNSNVKWGVVGIQDYFGTNTVFVTDPNATSTTTQWSPLSATDQQTVGGDVNGMAGTFLTTGNGGATAPDGKIQTTSMSQSYYDYSPSGTISFGASFHYYDNGGINSSSRSQYLTELVASDAGGAGLLADGSATVVGKFTINLDGSISYSTAGNANSGSTLTLDSSTYAVSEADANGYVAINITRGGVTTGTCSVNVTTTNGTAVSGTDFTGLTNSLVSFAANQTSASVHISVANRTGFQGDRSFTVGLSNPSTGATLGSATTATVTIHDASPGTIAFSATSSQIGSVDANGNPNKLSLVFTRTSGTYGAVSVDVSVSGGSLASGTDYIFSSPTTVNFADGQASATLDVQLSSISTNKLPGTIAFQIGNAQGGATLGSASTSTITVIPQPLIHFENSTYSQSEADGSGLITFNVIRDGDTSGTCSASFSTGDGTAISGTDYTAKTATVSFAQNQTSAQVSVGIVNRSGYQGDRTFSVNLSNASTGALLTAPSTATVTILESSPIPVGEIAFSATTSQVGCVDGSNNPNKVTLSLVRTSGTHGAVSVDVSSIGGTLASGTDYTFTNPTTVNFADGQTSATLDVQLSALAKNKLPGTMAFELSNATGGASIGSLSQTTVTVVNNKPAVPGKIAFSSASYQVAPRDNNGLPQTVAVTLARTTGTDGAVSVLLSATGGTLTSGSDYTFGPTTVNFADGQTSAQVNIPLNAIGAKRLPGTIILGLSNAQGGVSLGTPKSATVTITAADVAAPKLTLTSPKTGVVTGTFDLTGVVADNLGIDRVEVKFNGGATQLATLGTFTSGTASFTLAGLAPENGTNTIQIQAFDLQGNKVTLSKTVNYTNNRPALAGGYNGLITTGSGVTPSINNSGFVTIAVTNAGSFTGKVNLGGNVLPINGIFGNDGTAHFKPSLASTLALIVNPKAPINFGVLSLVLDTGSAGKITGTLVDSNSNVLANIDTDRAYFDGKVTLVDAKFLKNKGTYTAVLASKAQVGSPSPTTYPQGDGVALVTVSAKGVVTLKGTLPDGTALSASAPLSKDYTWPCFAALYGKKGLVAGQITMDGSTPITSVKGIDVLWFRPAIANSKAYAAGWTGGITFDLLGSEYAVPATTGTSVFPGLKPVDTVNGNATLEFTDGKLPGALDKSLNIDGTNKATNLTTAGVLDKSFSLSLTANSGKIAGSFTHSDATKTSYQGIILQNDVNAGTYILKAGGYGFFLSNTSTLVTTSESGEVTLSAK